MSVTELAALPTAPTVSTALSEASRYAGQGPVLALRKAFFGSMDPDVFIPALTPEHAIAEGVALIVAASLIDPEVGRDDWPTAAWSASLFSERVGEAHVLLTGWALTHSRMELGYLFEAAADRARTAEAGR